MTLGLTWIDDDDVRYPLTLDEHALAMVDSTGLDAAPVTVISEERAQDGAAVSGVRAPSKTIVLPIFFDDFDHLDEMAETFIGRPSRLERDNGAGRVRELLDVYYVGGLEGDGTERFGPGAAREWKRRVIELRALDPYWYGPIETLGLGVPETPDDYNAAIPYNSAIPWDGPGGGISSGLVWDPAIAWDNSYPYDGGAVVTPAITSRVGGWPRIEVLGPASFIQIIHLRTGQLVQTIAALDATKTLAIEGAPSGRGVFVDGTSAWGMVTPNSDAAMQLVAGDSLAIVVSGTNANSYVTITWRQRWRMP